MPIKTFWSSITGKNCTGDGGDSILLMASTAIAFELIVLGFLIHKTHSHVLFFNKGEKFIMYGVHLQQLAIDAVSHHKLSPYAGDEKICGENS